MTSKVFVKHFFIFLMFIFFAGIIFPNWGGMTFDNKWYTRLQILRMST